MFEHNMALTVCHSSEGQTMSFLAILLLATVVMWRSKQTVMAQSTLFLSECSCIVPNLDDFSTVFSGNVFGFIGSFEAWLNDDVLDSEIIPTGMQESRSSPCSHKKGGCVLIYVRNNLGSRRWNGQGISIEIIWAELN